MNGGRQRPEPARFTDVVCRLNTRQNRSIFRCNRVHGTLAKTWSGTSPSRRALLAPIRQVHRSSKASQFPLLWATSCCSESLTNPRSNDRVELWLKHYTSYQKAVLSLSLHSFRPLCPLVSPCSEGWCVLEEATWVLILTVTLHCCGIQQISTVTTARLYQASAFSFVKWD